MDSIFKELDSHVSRRVFLRRATSGGAALALPGLIAACGGTSSGSPTTASANLTANPLAVSPGATIPQVTVNFGMAPFGDASFYVIAIKRGWFKDVGITIGPGEFGAYITPDNIVTKMVTHEVDIATFYGPGKVATLQAAPQLKMFGFSDLFIGTYLLAAPHSGVKTVSGLVAGGVPFAQAVKQAMGQVRGKSAAFNNSGEQRAFLDAIFKLGGVTFNDVKLTVTTDSQIVSLAEGGQIEFASANGAAQIVELLAAGWYPLIGVSDLLHGLPPGDPRAVSGIGNEGPACSSDYYTKNRETCLRFLAVMFRTIDAIQADPDGVLPDQVPYLSSASGAPVTVPALKRIYQYIDPLVPFDQQGQFWGSSPTSADVVYGAQIKAAESGGILNSSQHWTVEDAIIGGDAYRTLVALKGAYDSLKAKAGTLTGQKASLANQAAVQYANRNYLDAYRILKTAVGA